MPLCEAVVASIGPLSYTKCLGNYRNDINFWGKGSASCGPTQVSVFGERLRRGEVCRLYRHVNNWRPRSKCWNLKDKLGSAHASEKSQDPSSSDTNFDPVSRANAGFARQLERYLAGLVSEESLFNLIPPEDDQRRQSSPGSGGANSSRSFPGQSERASPVNSQLGDRAGNIAPTPPPLFPPNSPASAQHHYKEPPSGGPPLPPQQQSQPKGRAGRGSSRAGNRSGGQGNPEALNPPPRRGKGQKGWVREDRQQQGRGSDVQARLPSGESEEAQATPQGGSGEAQRSPPLGDSGRGQGLSLQERAALFMKTGLFNTDPADVKEPPLLDAAPPPPPPPPRPPPPFEGLRNLVSGNSAKNLPRSDDADTSDPSDAADDYYTSPSAAKGLSADSTGEESDTNFTMIDKAALLKARIMTRTQDPLASSLHAMAEPASPSGSSPELAESDGWTSADESGGEEADWQVFSGSGPGRQYGGYNDDLRSVDTGAVPEFLLDVMEGQSELEARAKRDQQMQLEFQSGTSAELEKIKAVLHTREMELLNMSRELEEGKAQLALLKAKATAELAQAQQAVMEKDMMLKAAEAALANLKFVQVEWWGQASRVELGGSFNGWQYFVPLEPDLSSEIPSSSSSGMDNQRGPMMWGVGMRLYPGVYEIKFIVDGRWEVDFRREVVTKNLNNQNNILRVE